MQFWYSWLKIFQERNPCEQRGKPVSTKFVRSSFFLTFFITKNLFNKVMKWDYYSWVRWRNTKYGNLFRKLYKIFSIIVFIQLNSFRNILFIVLSKSSKSQDVFLTWFNIGFKVNFILGNVKFSAYCFLITFLLFLIFFEEL